MSTHTKVQTEITKQLLIRDTATAAIHMLRGLIDSTDPEATEDVAVPLSNMRGRMAIPVQQIDPISGDVLATFDSQKDASIAVGRCGTAVSQAMAAGTKCAGYLWARADGKRVIKQSQSITVS